MYVLHACTIRKIFFLLVAIIGDLSLSSQLVVSNEEAGDFERDFSQFWREETTRPEKKNPPNFSLVVRLSLFFFAFSLSHHHNDHQHSPKRW